MLQIHSAGDLRVLARRLGEVLVRAPADPMQPDLVAVPSAGMRTWLSLQLARSLGTDEVTPSARPEIGAVEAGHAGAAGGSAGGRSDGVSANIEFPFPGSLRLRILAAGRAGPYPADIDPWAVERLVWPILEVADSSACGASLPAEELPALLVDPPAGSSRYGAARRIADLFDRYHLHRPAMVGSWALGLDLDELGSELAPQHRWQAGLWRAARAHIDQPSPPELLGSCLERLRAGDLRVDLPDRVCVFGMSLLPGGPGFLDLVRCLATSREVHLFVVEPSPVLAHRFGGSGARVGAAAMTRPGMPRLRKEVDTAVLHHPLLRSWGRLHFETAAVIAEARRSASIPVVEGHAAQVPTKSAGSGKTPTVLDRLQADIRADRVPVSEVDLVSPDDSVQFHACHGPTRQVEVLRDTILRLLDQHPHLQEDDVLVVCPDLDRFAPLIEATFGPSARTGGTLSRVGSPGANRSAPQLRYRLADRSLGVSAPLVGAFEALLEVVAGRFDAPTVLDFIALEPVRRRFGLGEEDLATITAWVLELRVRWGLDPSGREAEGIPPSVTASTWQAGVDRILLGSAVLGPADAPDTVEAIGGVFPHGLEGSEVVVAGRLCDILWRLGDLAADASSARSVGDWVDLLQKASLDLFSVSQDQTWQLDRLMRTLGELVESASRPDPSIPGSQLVSPTQLTFADMRRLVAERLGGIEGRPAFFRGGITVSSLTPLRWVPFAVIVMLGMDAPALSVGAADGDDLTTLLPLVGDRDRRGELRQSMLETVLSAGEHLVVIRDGNDVRTNQPVPMAVPVAELRGAVVAMVPPERREAFERDLEVAHPRQRYDERYLIHGDGGQVAARVGEARVPPTYDASAATAAEARRRAGQAPPFLDSPLLCETVTEIPLAELHRFLQNPIRYFVERRLELRLPSSEVAPTGVLDVKIAPLDKWALGDRLLRALAGSEDPGRVEAAWRRRAASTGMVPPGILGSQVLDEVSAEVGQMRAAAAELGVLESPVAVQAIDLELGDGTRILGGVPLLLAPSSTGDSRTGTARVLFNRPRSAHTLATWLDLAALVLAEPGRSVRAVTVTRNGRDGGRAAVHHWEMNPDDPIDAARVALSTIVGLFRRGLTEPLPIFGRLSEKLFERPWSVPEWPGRHPDDAELLVYGGLRATELLSIPLRAGDPAGAAADRARRYAEHLHGTLRVTMSEVRS